MVEYQLYKPGYYCYGYVRKENERTVQGYVLSATYSDEKSAFAAFSRARFRGECVKLLKVEVNTVEYSPDEVEAEVAKRYL